MTIDEVAQTPVSKMFYTNFDSQITAKHGVIVINWPLKLFSSPSDIGSMTELKVLYNTWKTGTTTFRKLTPVEWEDWETTHFNACMAELQQVDEIDSQLQTNYRSTAVGSSLFESSQSPLPTPMPSSQLDGHDAGPTFASFRLPATQAANAWVVTDAMTMLGMNGQGVTMVKKPRKVRFDKEKKHGPRSGHAASAVPAPGTASMSFISPSV